MKCKRSILTLWLLTLFLFLPALASAQTNTLVIEQTDGTLTTFALANQPMIKCQQGVFNCSDSTKTIEVDLSEVKCYRFSHVATRVESPIVQPTLQVGSGFVRFERLKANSRVAMYAVNGKLIAAAKANEEGVAEMQFDSNLRGVVILKTDTTSYKIILKH